MGKCMFSRWFKTTNCKILHLNFVRVFLIIRDKAYGKNCYLSNFLFLLLFSSWQCWETMSKICIKLRYGFATSFRGRGRIFNHTFQSSHNILSMIADNMESPTMKVVPFFHAGTILLLSSNNALHLFSVSFDGKKSTILKTSILIRSLQLFYAFFFHLNDGSNQQHFSIIALFTDLIVIVAIFPFVAII